MNKLERSMNTVLHACGIPYSVAWQPRESEKHAIIDTATRRITIFSETEQEAWATLVHEALELKIRPLLAYYRELVNTLISFIEKRAYLTKEEFLESLPGDLSRIMFEVENARKRNQNGAEREE